MLLVCRGAAIITSIPDCSITEFIFGMNAFIINTSPFVCWCCASAVIVTFIFALERIEFTSQ
jgi:hypothetical protein